MRTDDAIEPDVLGNHERGGGTTRRRIVDVDRTTPPLSTLTIHPISVRGGRNTRRSERPPELEAHIVRRVVTLAIQPTNHGQADLLEYLLDDPLSQRGRPEGNTSSTQLSSR